MCQSVIIRACRNGIANYISNQLPPRSDVCGVKFTKEMVFVLVCFAWVRWVRGF